MSVQVRDFEPGDAAAVTRMWQASDTAWPGGFYDGLLMPPGRFLESWRDRNVISTYIAWADGRAVGFADIYPVPDEERVGYLGLLNSDPAFHGRGVGRDLIRRCIDRCIELGFKRLDLHTWPGNTRAVPLYRKTGFGWGPEEEKLQNHMPLLLSHPLTRGYFERTDWYASTKRDTQLGYETARRNGALVFPYLWESEHGTLRAVFDQKAKALVELETPELLLSLETGEFEMLRGREQTARLSVRNKRDSALSIAVTASGSGPVSASHYAMVEVGAGQEEIMEIKLSASAEEVGEGSLKLNVLVENHPIEMAATIKVAAALDLRVEPVALPLRPGVVASAALNLHNRLPHPVDVELLPSASARLEVTLGRRSVRLEPG